MALAWLHLLAAGLLAATTIVTVQTLYYSNIFTAAGSTILPLNILMGGKAVSGLFVFLAWFRNADGGDFLNTFGCVRFERFKKWYRRRRKVSLMH